MTQSRCQYCLQLLQSISQLSRLLLQGHLSEFQSDLQRDSVSDKSTSSTLLFSPLLEPVREPEPEPDLPRESLLFTGLTYSERLEPPLYVLDLLDGLMLKGLVRGEGVVG